MLARGGIETSPKYSKTRHSTWRSVDLESGIFDAQFGSEPYQVHENQPPEGTYISYVAPKTQSGLGIFHALFFFVSVV